MDPEALQPGSIAPDFNLPDQNGVYHSLLEYRGHLVFLCFYATDGLAGCIKEVSVLRNNFKSFEKFGITILGVSADSIENHKHFAEKYNLPFLLLSDARRKVAQRYEVLRREEFSGNYEEITQISFLINPASTIEKIYTHINPARHATEVLNDFAKMQKEDEDLAEL